MSMPRLAVSMSLTGLLVLKAGMVAGQDFPSKPIRIYTTTAAGANDLIARLVGSGLGDNVGWPVIVDNRPSALIAADIVAKAPPDGYALLVSTDNLWIGPFLQKVPYDPVRDFLPITLATTAPNTLVVHPSLPVKTVKDLIALAKAKPGQLNYGAGAIGASTHLASELFKYMAGVDIMFVPYKSSGTAVISLVGGQIQLMFGSAGTMSPHIKSGRVRVVAVTTPEPSALFPGVPTVAASGVPGYEAAQLAGIFAPARTPVATINLLNREIVRALNKPDVREKFMLSGMESAGSSPQDLAAKIKSEMSRLGKVIKDAGISAE